MIDSDDRKPMKVLVACEFSGIVREAFAAKGHNAWSCDLIDTEIPGQHIIGNVLDILDQDWDLIIAHPPCTYLANSSARHLYGPPSPHSKALYGIPRWKAMIHDAVFFRDLLNAPSPRVCIENPIQHRYARQIIGQRHSQIVHPWQYGHGETKATALWLKGLEPLVPTNIVSGRHPAVHRASPGIERWKDRSRTYPGIATAMAEQWGKTV